MLKRLNIYFKERYPIISDMNTHSTTILNSKLVNFIDEIPKLKKFGVTSFRVELFDEDYHTTKEILSTIIDKMFT